MAKKNSSSAPPPVVVPALVGDAHTGDAPAIVEAIQPKKCKYGMGYKESVYPAGTLSTRHLFGATGPMPNSASLEQYVDYVRDQGQTSRCVGEAIARALHLRLGSMGFPGRPYPSALGIYTLAREGERSGDEALQDQGSQPYTAVSQLATVGIPRETVWPPSQDPSVVNAPLPLDVLQEAVDYELQGYYRIDSDGYQKCSDIRQALSSGYPVTMAIQVDQAFEDCSGGNTLTAPSGYLYGGHYLCIVGYEGSIFRVCNSWGTSWGDRGFCWMDESAIIAASDFLVIQTTPKW